MKNKFKNIHSHILVSITLLAIMFVALPLISASTNGLHYESEPKLSRTHIREERSRDPHGAYGPFSLFVEPDSVRRIGGKEEWLLAVVFENHRNSPAHYASYFVVHTAKGREASPPQALPTLSARANSSAELALPVPPNLENGIYRLRVTSASSDGSPEGETVLTVEIFFEIQLGALSFIDVNEFFSRPEISQANEG